MITVLAGLLPSGGCEEESVLCLSPSLRWFSWPPLASSTCGNIALIPAFILHVLSLGECDCVPGSPFHKDTGDISPFQYEFILISLITPVLTLFSDKFTS